MKLPRNSRATARAVNVSHLSMRPLWVGIALVLGTWSLPAMAQPAPTPRPKADQEAQASGFVLDQVVAVVNDAVILASELRTRAAPLIADLDSISDARERERRERKIVSQVLEEMVSEELIVEAAAEAKLQVEAREIDAAIDEIKKQNQLDDEGFSQALRVQGYSLGAYRQDVEKQILRMRAINMLVRPRVTVTDEDVRARYDAQSRRSGAVEKIRLQHILIGLPEEPSEAQVAEAKQEAAEVIERARAGEAFAELAAKHSDDAATAESAGDLGWIERGSIASEWEAIVFSMEKGEVRGPVSGPSGLHVFYVGEVEQADLASFEESKEQLRNEIYRREMDKQTQQWLSELRKKAYVDIKR